MNNAPSCSVPNCHFFALADALTCLQHRGWAPLPIGQRIRLLAFLQAPDASAIMLRALDEPSQLPAWMRLLRFVAEGKAWAPPGLGEKLTAFLSAWEGGEPCL
jgi:hypothetical protein